MSLRTWDRGTTHFKSDSESRVDRRRARKAQEESHRAEVYRAVTLRDSYRCRACGRACDPSSPDSLRRAHHHHITFRSKGGDDTTANICLLDAQCHDLVHVKRTLELRGNADTSLEVWRLSKDHGWYLDTRQLGPNLTERD